MRLASVIAALFGAALPALPSFAQTGGSPVPPEPAPETQAVPEVPASTEPQLMAADVAAWTDGFMPYALQRGGVAGAVVVVVKDGEVLFQKGYGYADAAAGKPVDPERTLFRPGSTSKLLTWTAVMQQVEQGKLELDADVNTYLDFEIPARDGKPITLRNIMTHTPGFEESLKGLITDDASTDLSLEAYLKRWTPERIFPPGSTPAYSNYATALAGYIVARVSGQSFDEYIEQHIFEPLGMAHSSFRQPLPERLQAGMSRGYSFASEPAKPYELIPAAPAGALASTGADMARFMIAHLQDGAYGDNRILEPETARQMHTTEFVTLPPLNGMALGFYQTHCNGNRVIAHGGDTQWFHTDLHLFIDQGVGLYVSMNSAGKDGATGAIRETLFREFCDRYFPGPTAEGTVDAATAAGHAGLVSGRYTLSRRSESSFFSLLNLISQVKVFPNEDGTLTVSMLEDLAGQPQKWREIAPFVWREVGGKSLLAAKLEDGRVVRLGVDTFSPIIVFEPAPWWRSSAWLLPLLIVAVCALALTGLFWPVAALVRRHYGARLNLAGTDLKAYRWSRIAAAAVTVTLLIWGVTLASMMADINLLSSSFDGLFWLLQLLSLVVFVGAVGVMLWNARVVWTAKRGWVSKVWSGVLVVSCLSTLWVALTFKLIGFDVNY